jgi:hypothetical protein
MKMEEKIIDGAVIAAIAMALTEQSDDVHDIEKTELTIQKVSRRYSPWNSKIYNMRDFQKNRT